MLKAGIPLAKADQLRLVLEDGAHSLSDSTHLASYIPFILESEREPIKQKVSEKPYISVIFYGSTYQGEGLVIVLRFVGNDFKICQRLV